MLEKEALNCDVVLQVLEKLRIEANTLFRANNQPREKSSIVNSLQSFLFLAFMVAVPPIHSKVYCELEVGKTFLKGLYQDGVFTPESALENPDLALWYVYSPPIEYKTGHSDEWLRCLPNIEFVDGTNLYEYIDKWLTYGREYHHKCDHNYFFISTNNSKPLSSQKWFSRIAFLFKRHSGVRVSPKELRKRALHNENMN